MQEDEQLLKSLRSCQELHEQGYEHKVRRILSRHGVAPQDCRTEEQLEALAEKVRDRLDRAKNKKKQEQRHGEKVSYRSRFYTLIR